VKDIKYNLEYMCLERGNYVSQHGNSDISGYKPSLKLKDDGWSQGRSQPEGRSPSPWKI